MHAATCFTCCENLSHPNLEQHDTERRPQRQELRRTVQQRIGQGNRDGTQRGFLFARPLRSQALKSTWFISSRGLLIFSSTRITLPLRNGQEIEFSITIKQRLSAACQQHAGGCLWRHCPWNYLSQFKQKQEGGSIIAWWQACKISIHSKMRKVTIHILVLWVICEIKTVNNLKSVHVSLIGPWSIIDQTYLQRHS